MRYPTVLTIAGSDSGGGAGIQADLKTLAAWGVYGASVVTAVTAQNTREVRSIHPIPAEEVRRQLEAVLDDLPVDVLKTGMLVSPEIIKVLAETLDKYQNPPVVVDPVLAATCGTSFVCKGFIRALREQLYPRISLLTPNLSEAEQLTSISIHDEISLYTAGTMLIKQGCPAVLIKGGHRPAGEHPIDLLFTRNAAPLPLAGIRVETGNSHGTGCTLASAIAACLALGYPLPEAARRAKRFVMQALKAGAAADFGGASGPLNPFFDPQPLKPII